MKIAIIGCGYSGLFAIRRCIELQLPCTAFELSDQLGGLWVYTEKQGTDEFGIPIQTSLYYSVRTNSPKQTLELPDFKFETEEDTCYPRHFEVRTYLNKFADNFNLRPHIKFNHYVAHVTRSENQWKIKVIDLKNDVQEEYYFDAVMICNGHTTKPFIPKITGIESFLGTQLHSHDYRREDIFQNKVVLVIGNSASGIELAIESSTTYITHRGDKSNEFFIGSNVIWKPEIRKIRNNKVIFSDSSIAEVDILVYCTGYQYSYPFLDSTCKIVVKSQGQIVSPLYKHYINIEHPTMCFIGLFQRTIISYLFDLQVRAFLKFLTNQIPLPSKNEMLKWLKNENESKLKNPPNHYYHQSTSLEEYYEDLCAYADLQNISPVLFKIFKLNDKLITEDFLNLRKYHIEILDDQNFSYYVKS